MFHLYGNIGCTSISVSCRGHEVLGEYRTEPIRKVMKEIKQKKRGEGVRRRNSILNVRYVTQVTFISNY